VAIAVLRAHETAHDFGRYQHHDARRTTMRRYPVSQCMWTDVGHDQQIDPGTRHGARVLASRGRIRPG